MKFILAALVALGAALSTGQPASAQEAFPTKVVKLVVPFAAGGGTDLLARILAERLGAAWNQSVIVDNRPGAAGAIGTDVVAKAKNDGYTILLGTASTHAVGPSLIPKLPYNTQRDFVPITELATSPFVLLAHPTLKVNSVSEFVDLAKSKPGEIPYNGTTGTGGHMAMELLAARAGKVELLPISYKGSGPAMIDLVAGQLLVGFNDVPPALPFVREGKLRALAVTGTNRTPLLPQVPTIAESGYPGYDADVWYGLFAPAGTPPHIVKKIAADVRTALTEPSTRKKLEESAFAVVASSPIEFNIRVKADVEKWRKLIKDNNIKMN
jgi:tripartite-type tricarboxylate transporter receptor subunit TctC